MSTRVAHNAKSAVQYFDMEQIMPGASILIIGKRCSGKSNLLFDIMSRIAPWFSYGLALTPTQSSKAKFSRCIPSLFIDRQSPERLENYVKQVNSFYDAAVGGGKEPKKTFLLCDDTAFDKKFMNSKTLSEVFLNGRNFGMTCILVLQYLMRVGPDLRCNADFVFVFWDNTDLNQENIRKFWFNMMPKEIFTDVFSAVTKDYSCMVMDVRKSATSRDWKECVFWYKATLADEIPSFQMCEPDFFKMNDFCKVEGASDRKVQENSADVVWRLGPDGKVYDIPTVINKPTETTSSESSEEEEEEEEPRNAFRKHIKGHHVKGH